MSNHIKDQIAAYGVAQVLVVLKDIVLPVKAAKASAALAAAIPVPASRSVAGHAESLVMELAKHFRISELSTDTALAKVIRARKRKAAGATWYQHAESASDPTPPVRFFPNLGLLLG